MTRTGLSFNSVVKSSRWLALGKGALPKRSGCNAHDKPAAPDFQ